MYKNIKVEAELKKKSGISLIKNKKTYKHVS